MAEAVIVATARSPIGRAFKGSLVNERPDDISSQIVKAALDQVPELDPNDVEDLILGTGSPAGEQGFNMARVVALMSGMDNVPGVTINRYCSSSLQTIRMAAHAIRAGEGDAFVAAGAEFVSRYGNGASDNASAQNPIFADAQKRTESRSGGEAETWSPPEGLPDIYIAMGQTAENVAQLEDVSREAQRGAGVNRARRVTRHTGTSLPRIEDPNVPCTKAHCRPGGVDCAVGRRRDRCRCPRRPVARRCRGRRGRGRHRRARRSHRRLQC